MPPRSLARRKSQLELLAQACAQRQAVRVAARVRATARPEMNTRLLALHPDGVVLEWPAQGSELIPVSGAAVDVSFEHRAEPFGFRTETRGRMWWSSESQRQIAAWKLALPLCVEPRQPRRHFRLSLAGLAPVAARCTSVTHTERTFTAQLQNLSASGLRVTAAGRTGAPPERGELLWVEFKLPAVRERFEFVVCVAHVRMCAPKDLVVFGAMFCPSEDHAEHCWKLRRIEQFVARHAADEVGCARAGRVGGA